MAKQTINIGTAPNDGTGDPIRDAFDKVNDNFDELYSAVTSNSFVSVGNSTVNTTISNSSVTSSNATDSAVVTFTNFKIGNTTANASLTGAAFAISGSATLGSASVNTSAVALGNSTVNASHSVTTSQIANATSNVTVTAGSIFVGNSTVNAAVNSSVIRITSANVTSNTLSLGTSTAATNGYSYLPNGFKMNWGWVSANSTDGNAVFASAFTTTYSVTATSNTVGPTYAAAVTEINAGNTLIRTANATSVNVFFMAIGK